MSIRLLPALACAVVAALALNAAPAAYAQSGITYTYTTLIPFGTSFTSALGINDAGQVVGIYQSSGQSVFGYVGMAGSSTYMTVAVPSYSTNTRAYGISNSGQIVGSYFNFSSQSYNGFSAASGSNSFTTIDPFNAPFAETLSINNVGQIGGDYQVPGSAPGNSGIGAIYGYAGSASGGFTTVDPFGSAKTVVSGINDSGQIVGYYNEAVTNKQLGYVGAIGSSNFTTIDPFGAFDTSVNGINNAGQIVGYYDDPHSGSTLSYVGTLGGSNYTVVDPFHSQFAFVNGINNAGQIVGEYQDPVSGNYYGFLGTPSAAVPEAASVTSLGLLLGMGGLMLYIRRRSAA